MIGDNLYGTQPVALVSVNWIYARHLKLIREITTPLLSFEFIHLSASLDVCPRREAGDV